ncbi:hypothetical protein GA0074692_4118 [Micromonospora pallida]|uniref:NhaP-type Na+/H+ or K+/H+ antiporter n=1 Tax=Micromonospora pallida TaxID=145854 RepID=A0A1C6T1L3_9ACTN|nr:hypothetical protein [Micromonospora pallida]SCL35539.1 hypothetical protein GA0074692_4118 [Micromonospora pallida]
MTRVPLRPSRPARGAQRPAGRRWRPSRSAVDRTGRRTGVREAVLPSLTRTGTFVLVAALGWLLAENRDWVGTYRSDAYLTLAGTLLAVGLYASTYGIDLRAARRNARLVVFAITGGVVVKAALISAVMYLAFREPAYLVLGVAVAQIDPVSFAAARLQSRMSAQAKTILSAWASFDDPITVLLTVYAAAWVWPLVPADPAAATAPPHTGFESFGLSLVQNLALAAVAALVWWGTERLRRWVRPGRLVTALQLVALAGLAAFAVWQFLMLALAVAGLFYRPPLGAVLDRLTQVAFLAASFALGLVLVGGISPLAGAVLGLAAVGAHVVVALLVGRRLPRSDRVDVLLGQQNGITAIILALVLERQFVGTVAVVAPAILTVNVLHALTNGVREAYRRPGPDVPPLSPRRG